MSNVPAGVSESGANGGATQSVRLRGAGCDASVAGTVGTGELGTVVAGPGVIVGLAVKHPESATVRIR